MTVPNRKFQRGAISGAIVTGIVAMAGISAVVVAFVNNASPYGSFADARQGKSDSIHVSGDLVKDSVHMNLGQGSIEFAMKDDKGEQMKVIYTGPPPGNMAEATKIVAIGGVQPDGRFHSNKLLIKCPSKYEGEKAKSS